MIFALAAALVVIAIMAALGVVLALAMASEDGAQAAEQRAAAGEAEPRVPGWTLLGRAFARRCPRCAECGAVFWVDRGEWLGAFVLDWACATGLAIVVWAALEAFARLPQIAEIAIISGAVMLSLFATFPWSRSLWTVFLYLTGVMGERPATAQEASDPAAPPAASPPPL